MLPHSLIGVRVRGSRMGKLLAWPKTYRIEPETERGVKRSYPDLFKKVALPSSKKISKPSLFRRIVNKLRGASRAK